MSTATASGAKPSAVKVFEEARANAFAERSMQRLVDAGFDAPEVHELEHDPMNYDYIMRV